MPNMNQRIQALAEKIRSQAMHASDARLADLVSRMNRIFQYRSDRQVAAGCPFKFKPYTVEQVKASIANRKETHLHG